MSRSIVVLKFGSSVLRSRASLPVAVAEVYRHYREGEHVIGVVSAFEGVTDSLLKSVASLNEPPDPAALAALLSTGEIQSGAELTFALTQAGVPAQFVDPRDVDLCARGPRADAKLSSVSVSEIKRHLADTPVLIIPGFFARHVEGGLCVLGRGGSDLTALYLAAELNARCVLLKDVDGLYEADPASDRECPRRFVFADYVTAELCGGALVQPKAIEFAHESRLAIDVARIGSTLRTRIGEGPNVLGPLPPPRPLRVALFGLGTVGGGVFDYLQHFPDLFEVVAALVRTPGKHLRRGVPENILVTTAESAFERKPDIIVEALPGLEPARHCLRLALKADLTVVTANKAVIASDWLALGPHLFGPRRQIRCAATAGGGVPMLETVERLGRRTRVLRLRGVLNATSNFLLDQCQTGATFDEAIRRAQVRGLAESDPSEDLSGADSARKMEILGRIAFGGSPQCDVLEGCAGKVVRSLATAHGAQVRLIAEAERTAQGFTYRVRLLALAPDDFLAGTRGAENRLEIALADGTVVRLAGLGAGRIPTATAIFADVLEHARVLHGVERTSEEQQSTPAPGREAEASRSTLTE